MAIYEEGYMIQLVTAGGRKVYLTRVNMEGDTFYLEWSDDISKALKFPINTDMNKIKIYYDLAKYWQEDGKATCVLYRVTVDEVQFSEVARELMLEVEVPEITLDGKSDKYQRSLQKLLSAMRLFCLNNENGNTKTVTQVAQAVGYADASGLGNAMKENIGMNPTDFTKLEKREQKHIIDMLESLFV